MELRKWQKKALLEWKKEYSGIVKVVTGGGKTFFAIKCIQEILNSKKDFQFLVLVPTVTLLDQWIIDLEAKMDSKISKIGGGFDTGFKEKICVCTYGSFKKIAKTINKKKTLLICDECHKAGTEKLGHLLEGDWGSTLGLSATPERDFDDNFENILVPILGKIIFDYDYVEAHKDKIISNFELMNVYAPMMKSEDEAYDEITKKIGKRIAVIGGFKKSDQPLKILFFKRARIVNSARNRVPAALKIIKSFKNRKWIVFSETIDQANAFKKVLEKNKYKCAVYHSDVSPVKRQHNIYLLKNELIDVLITCKSLDEGFDYPSLDSAIVLSSSSTSRQRIQRLGRVLRIADEKDKSIIVSIYTSDDEYERLRNEQIFFSEIGIETTWSRLSFK